MNRPAPEAAPLPMARCLSFDFEKKADDSVPPESARALIDAGRFIWLDVDMTDGDAARALLAPLALIPEDLLEDALDENPTTHLSRFESCLHFSLTGCHLFDDGLHDERVDALVGEHFLLTLHRGRASFLESVRKHYRDDFVRFAHTPSFLLYELLDQLIENYQEVQQKLEDRVKRVQGELVGEGDDSVFQRVSALGANLLHFRTLVVPTREIVAELSTRRSPFVSESTQRFLANMVFSLERVLQDIIADRDILNDSVTLYVSILGHRTNLVMRKLTIVSVIFMPLTFLCGIYGMNFEFIPELRWRYAYLGFWGVTATVVVGLLLLMRRHRML
ncbi:MAG: hypothetical protein EXR73_01940 [Myxococcales bacterium]|nr:hypothetical protein [Myxococcales bacterium]